MSKVTKIVLAGGSCAGKTSAQKYLMKMLDTNQVKVLLIPEVASLLLNNGIIRNEYSVFNFQKYIFETQKKLETIFEQIASESHDYVLIICDRGSCDSKAFLSSYEWNKLMKKNNTTMEIELNSYDAVFYLPSVAMSFPNYYENTNIRSSTEEMAKKESMAIYNIWKKHKNFFEINNYEKFEQKLNELLYFVDSFLKSRM